MQACALFLFLLFGACGARPQAFSCHEGALGNSYAEFQRAHAGWPHERALDQLYAWCANDTLCARSYYLEEGVETGRAAFGYLVGKWLPRDRDHGLASLVTEGVCGASSLPALLRHMWLLEMRVQSYEQTRIRCGTNERFVFSELTFEGHCVCVEDRNCADAGNWRSSYWNYSTVAQVLTSGVLTLLFATQFCTAQATLRTFHHIRRMKGGEEAKRAFVESLRK